MHPVERAGWETFAHGADIGVRGFGRTREQAFAGAALAVTGVVTDPAGVRPVEPVPLRCTGAGDDLLLYAWLNTVITEMALRRMLFSRFDVSIERDQLAAVAHGEPVDVARHAPAVEVKGATFTELTVRRDGDRWIAQCVVDV